MVEQSNDGKKFNRGKLLNVGYKLAVAEGYNIFIYHGVTYYRVRSFSHGTLPTHNTQFILHECGPAIMRIQTTVVALSHGIKKIFCESTAFQIIFGDGEAKTTK